MLNPLGMCTYDATLEILARKKHWMGWLATTPSTKETLELTLILSKHETFVIDRNNLNGFWDLYHGPDVGADAPKVHWNYPVPTWVKTQMS
jgi:hypothetical protein